MIDKKIEKYAEEHSSAEGLLLSQLSRATYADVMQPKMLSGHLQGRVLAMFSKMIRPSRIVEIGTFTGYSALCLAEGLTLDGSLTTIDVNEELETFTRSFFEKSAFAHQIDYRIGNALDIVPTLPDSSIDLVFIDANKQDYLKYYDAVFDKVKSGGYIVADNVLWYGKVIDTDKKIAADTQVLLDFNQKIREDERVENVLLTIRDGLMIARKK